MGDIQAQLGHPVYILLTYEVSHRCSLITVTWEDALLQMDAQVLRGKGQLIPGLSLETVEKILRVYMHVCALNTENANSH